MIPVPKKLHTRDFILTVEFADGQIRQIDVRTFLGSGKKADEVKTSPTIFKTAFIEDELSITWKNGFSLDPDVVYEDGLVLQKLPAVSEYKKVMSAKVIKALHKVLE
jgi:hypothetical protein